MWQISHLFYFLLFHFFWFFFLDMTARDVVGEVAKGKPRDVTMSCYKTLLKVEETQNTLFN